MQKGAIIISLMLLITNVSFSQLPDVNKLKNKVKEKTEVTPTKDKKIEPKKNNETTKENTSLTQLNQINIF